MMVTLSGLVQVQTMRRTHAPVNSAEEHDSNNRDTDYLTMLYEWTILYAV